MLLDSLDEAIQEQFFQLFLTLAFLGLLGPASEHSEHARIFDFKFEGESHLCIHFRLLDRCDRMRMDALA